MPSGATASRTWSSTAATCTPRCSGPAERAGVDLVTDAKVIGYEQTPTGGRAVTLRRRRRDRAGW